MVLVFHMPVQNKDTAHIVNGKGKKVKYAFKYAIRNEDKQHVLLYKQTTFQISLTIFCCCNDLKY